MTSNSETPSYKAKRQRLCKRCCRVSPAKEAAIIAGCFSHETISSHVAAALFSPCVSLRYTLVTLKQRRSFETSREAFRFLFDSQSGRDRENSIQQVLPEKVLIITARAPTILQHPYTLGSLENTKTFLELFATSQESHQTAPLGASRLMMI